jgi:hypothetical protein
MLRFSKGIEQLATLCIDISAIKSIESPRTTLGFPNEDEVISFIGQCVMHPGFDTSENYLSRLRTNITFYHNIQQRLLRMLDVWSTVVAVKQAYDSNGWLLESREEEQAFVICEEAISSKVRNNIMESDVPLYPQNEDINTSDFLALSDATISEFTEDEDLVLGDDDDDGYTEDHDVGGIEDEEYDAGVPLTPLGVAQSHLNAEAFQIMNRAVETTNAVNQATDATMGPVERFAEDARKRGIDSVWGLGFETIDAARGHKINRSPASRSG